MVRKCSSTYQAPKSGNHIKADVIILGCTLPGIVTAHKLKRKFGDTVDIVVLNLMSQTKSISKLNVAFQDIDEQETPNKELENSQTAKRIFDDIARYYIAKYAEEFKIPLPDAIINPTKISKTPLHKLFQHRNGSTVHCAHDFHDFEYLNLLEKFEINQYQALLDKNMMDLFHAHKVDFTSDRSKLLYYDQTTMEKHICDALFFSAPREIMRMTVRLVCGAPADTVSVLFYLHQCYRTSSSRNHLDGDNTRFREKVLGYCRKRLSHKLYQSIADITLTAKSIKEIRTYSEEEVILETIKGEKNYICNLLAMALNPEQLHNIRVEDQLLPEHLAAITRAMTPGHAKKFVVKYQQNFWTKQGYSGDILSVRGPIIWSMERPIISTTGIVEKYPTLMGYLMVVDNDKIDSKEAVLEQLVNIFGEEAAYPVSYKEVSVKDVFVPRCGDYVTLRRLTVQGGLSNLEWGALDIFADGDVAAALEAGHTAYLHLLTCLRPQAQTYEDLCTVEWPIFLSEGPFNRWMANINLISSFRWTMYTAILYVGVKLLRSYMKKQ